MITRWEWDRLPCRNHAAGQSVNRVKRSGLRIPAKSRNYDATRAHPGDMGGQTWLAAGRGSGA